MIACRALRTLTPLFVAADADLTLSLAERLLSLADLNTRETATVKDALVALFAAVVEAEADGGGVGTDGNRSGHLSLYPVFLALITAHHEHHYALLEWALRAYVLISGGAVDAEDARALLGSKAASGTRAVPHRDRSLAWDFYLADDLEDDDGGAPRPAEIGADGSAFVGHARAHTPHFSERWSTGRNAQATEPLRRFVASLTNHLRTSQSLIRYGAALAIHTCVVACELLVDKVDIYPYVISGCLDADHDTAAVHLLSLAAIVQTRGDAELAGMIEHYQTLFAREGFGGYLDSDNGSNDGDSEPGGFVGGFVQPRSELPSDDDDGASSSESASSTESGDGDSDDGSMVSVYGINGERRFAADVFLDELLEMAVEESPELGSMRSFFVVACCCDGCNSELL